MRNPIVVTLLGFTALLSGTASSHHSVTAHFDMSRSIEIRGTVVDFKLRSPHASLVVDGQSYVDGVLQDETVQRWEIESSAAPGLRAMDLTADTFKAGDVITVVAAPNRQPGFRFVNSSNFTDDKGAQYSRGTATRNRNATADAVATQVSSAWQVAGTHPAHSDGRKDRHCRSMPMAARHGTTTTQNYRRPILANP